MDTPTKPILIFPPEPELCRFPRGHKILRIQYKGLILDVCGFLFFLIFFISMHIFFNAAILLIIGAYLLNFLTRFSRQTMKESKLLDEGIVTVCNIHPYNRNTFICRYTDQNGVEHSRTFHDSYSINSDLKSKANATILFDGNDPFNPTTWALYSKMLWSVKPTL
jgi:hypothetical protein